MRLIIDLQSLQGTNSNRGIGRYALSLTINLLKLCHQDEVFILLNGSLSDSVISLKEKLTGKVKEENFLIFSSLNNSESLHKENEWRQGAAEVLREAFIEQVTPDVVLITSLFEGIIDDTATSIINKNKNYKTAVVLYDLIPFISPSIYLQNEGMAKWYYKKVDHLRRADTWLAISESSRQEGIRYLAIPENKITNISTDADSNFVILKNPDDSVLKGLGITKPFIMYTGGIDKRKNIEGLISAFADLSHSVRKNHQLVIVCSVNNDSKAILNKLILDAGIDKNEVVITGFVSDEELVELYNQCALFVFPSFHEGFGLPVLEAMRCGAPVICSSLTSLPEVIGLPEAQFDPYNEHQFIMLMERALTDDNFRSQLISHAETQQKNFSWEKTAYKTYQALKSLSGDKNELSDNFKDIERKRLAYVTPVKPAKSGIANYSAVLLPELARYYEIDLIVKDNVEVDKVAESYARVRDSQYLLDNQDRYDRVIYQFGNSDHHDYMFKLLENIPGTVVLHDFYLSGVIQHVDIFKYYPGLWSRELLSGHGYKALKERHIENHGAEVVWRYPCSYSVLSLAQGVIVHSENSLRLAKEWYGNIDTRLWRVIPHLRELPLINNKVAARNRLAISQNAFVICSFGFLGESKLNDRLIDAFADSSLADADECHIVFVGELAESSYKNKLIKKIEALKLTARIKITGWASFELFQDYLQAADAAVQLRGLSRGETSGAVLDCMSYGLPTIINANGTMADINQDSVIMLQDKFEDASLMHALENIYHSRELREKISANAIEEIKLRHSIWGCTHSYANAIETFYASHNNYISEVVNSIDLVDGEANERDITEFSVSATFNKLTPLHLPTIFVDISELVQRDARSGIQRVVRSILSDWLNNPPTGYRVEPVYATQQTSGYFFARKFTCKFLGIEHEHFSDDPIEFRKGDVFVGLDLQPHITIYQEPFLKKMRAQGVKIHFVVYDLIPVLHPEYFLSPEDASRDHSKWLNTVAGSDSLICISQSVANQVKAWLIEHYPQRRKPLIEWFHLGADINSSHPTSGILNENADAITKTDGSKRFIMVGTLEPRKNHALAIDAFTSLWEAGENVALIIVGKAGWGVDLLIETIKSHPQFNKKLFWLNNVSDEMLDSLYKHSDCLIAASIAEGFGLPLIESSQNGIDIIASDIDVFKEVAQEHAMYFRSDDANSLKSVISEWVKLQEQGKQPKSSGLQWKTWQTSASDLLKHVLKHEEK